MTQTGKTRSKRVGRTATAPSATPLSAPPSTPMAERWAVARRLYEHGIASADLATLMGRAEASIERRANSEHWLKPDAARSARQHKAEVLLAELARELARQTEALTGQAAEDDGAQEKQARTLSMMLRNFEKLGALIREAETDPADTDSEGLADATADAELTALRAELARRICALEQSGAGT